MTTLDISSPQQLLDRLDRPALDALVARVVRCERLEEVHYHFHRQLLGAKGYNGMTCVLSVQYRSSHGIGWTDLLLKWPFHRSSEAEIYAVMMSLGAPVPRLEGIVALTQSPPERPAEVMVFEFLPHIGHGQQDYRAFARALGRFHALPPDRFPLLPNRSLLSEAPGWIETWARIRHHAQAGVSTCTIIEG